MGVAAWGVARFGSLNQALAYASGQRLLVDRAAKSFTLGPGEGVGRVEFVLSNHFDRPIRVLGVRTSCTCTVAGDVPMTIPAGGRRPLEVVVKVQPEARAVDESVVVLTDAPGRRGLALRVTGTRAAAADAPPSEPSDRGA
jgi:hypothetical protein